MTCLSIVLARGGWDEQLRHVGPNGRDGRRVGHIEAVWDGSPVAPAPRRSSPKRVC
jgi:hypothetical protein